MKPCSLRISWLWIPFLLFVPFLDLWKTLSFVFLFLSIHELAHILVAFTFHYPIQKVILYPFGLCAVIDSLGYRSGIRDLLILAAGPSTHLLQPLILQLLVYLGWISPVYYEYLCMMNASILLFNILPIYPLDGGRMLELLLQLLFPYTLAKRVVIALSILFVCIIAYERIFNGLSGLAVCMLLILENIMTYSSLTYQKLQFYHYRLQHPATYRVRMNSHRDLYRFSYNIMKHHEHWIKEEQWLSIFFHKR